MNKTKLILAIHPVVILFLGLIIAQVLATIQVHHSNLDLYNTLTEVSSAGYLAIPNTQTMVDLQKFGPAFWGGLFFTVTVGAGISLVAMAAAWIWVGVFLRQKSVLVFFLSIWAGLLILLNSNGFNLMPTLYFLLIAPAVFTLTAQRESMTGTQTHVWRRLFHFAPLPLLALLWFTQFDKDMFLDLRDHLLLSNHYGRKFSDFYYTYTLYPAEAFKALHQKTIKTAGMVNIQSDAQDQKIGRQLAANDYLPLPNATDADLVISQENDHLIFQADGRRVFQIPIEQFFENSQKVLQRFSTECDRNELFRQLTFLSLLIGFPVMLYMIFHAAVYAMVYFSLGRPASVLAASIICLVVGTSVLVYFQSTRGRSIPISDLSEALISDQWQARIAALKIIAQKKLDITEYPSYPISLNGRIPQERYWLVRALAFSRRPETFNDLLFFLNDDNLNVRTMAFYALGLRRDPRAMKPIISAIEKSDNWYDQMYAYKALRSLGWKQKRSR